MASSIKTISSQITLITFLLFTFSSAAPPSHPPRPFKKIYAFGDSYTDTGNTVSATGPSGFTYVSNLPYGRTFFHHPTNRYSDGRLVIDFVAESLSLPYLPPYQKPKTDTSTGVNFAVGGSTAIIHSFFVKNNITIDITPQSLQTQLGWFNKYMESKGCADKSAGECKAVFDESLIWVGEIGANDYAYSTLGSSVPSNTIQQLAIASVTTFLQAILNKGAKYVVVQGLPATGCLTLAMSLAAETDRDNMGCVASVNNQSYTHNAILLTKIQHLRKLFPRATIVYADFFNAHRAIINNSANYSFKELFKVCCGAGGGPYNFDFGGICGSTSSSSCQDPSQYINWDGVHLTETMYKVVSDFYLSGAFTEPSFRDLLSNKVKSGSLSG